MKAITREQFTMATTNGKYDEGVYSIYKHVKDVESMLYNFINTLEMDGAYV